MVAAKTSRLTSSDDLRKVRLAELDAAYTKQLKALSNIMRRTTRRSLSRLKHHL